VKVRVRFAKLGKIRWTSHRDVARMWERAFRRVQLPLAYSAGFSPRPKVSFGLALPTGHESLAEYLDIELLDGPVPGGAAAPTPADLTATLSAALPVGVDAVAAALVDSRAPSLQEEVTSCSWRFGATGAHGPVGGGELAERVAALLEAEEAPVRRTRKGVEVVEDVRPGIIDLQVTGAGWLEAELATRPRGLRPSEVLDAMGAGYVEADVRRLHQWISRDGARWEPLDGPAAATGASHASERAS
jgi:radical SAM-linked protein